MGWKTGLPMSGSETALCDASPHTGLRRVSLAHIPSHLLSKPLTLLSSKNPMTENTDIWVLSKHQALPLTEN